MKSPDGLKIHLTHLFNFRIARTRFSHSLFALDHRELSKDHFLVEEFPNKLKYDCDGWELSDELSKPRYKEILEEINDGGSPEFHFGFTLPIFSVVIGPGGHISAIYTKHTKKERVIMDNYLQMLCLSKYLFHDYNQISLLVIASSEGDCHWIQDYESLLAI